jgi:hypothetical protein
VMTTPIKVLPMSPVHTGGERVRVRGTNAYSLLPSELER